MIEVAYDACAMKLTFENASGQRFIMDASTFQAKDAEAAHTTMKAIAVAYDLLVDGDKPGVVSPDI